ncbi:MAG: DUF362 domain-containing protein [Anaerolineae bacterium]
MEERWTRRRFLTWAAALIASGAVFGSGCAGPSASPTASRRSAPTPAADQAYLAVAHGPDPAAITERAIAALGGIERFVKAGDAVVLKPNICVDYNPPEYAATTNPLVVATLVKLCLGAGAREVKVMDMPFGGTPESAYEISGIAKAVKDAGGEMVVMNRAKYLETQIPEGRDLQSWEIYGDVVNADVLINIPIAKHHSLARLSLGLKNLLGTVARPNQIHSNLGQRIADLASVIRPTLTVVDAVRILMDHGPTGGSLNDVKQADTIIASHDFVAADTRAAALFDLESTEIAFIHAAGEMGLGKTDLSGLRVEEFNI